MWKTVKLGDIIDVVMGQAPPGNVCNKDGIGTPFVKAGEFGALSPIIKEWTTEPKKMGAKGDVFLCVVGATCGKINLGADCAIGRSVASLRPHADTLLQMYLYYFMSQQVMQLRSGSLGAAQTVISKDMINSMSLLLPPLAEQQRIVAKLDAAFAEIDKAIGVAEAKEAEVDKLKALLLRVLLTGDRGMWAGVPFEQCLQKTKVLHKVQKNAYLESGSFPVVSQESKLISGYHNEASHVFKVEKPVVIFGDHTQVLKYVDFDFVVGADGVKILEPTQSLDTKYFYYFLKLLMPKSTGYARHYKLLKELAIPLPPIAEQERIVMNLDAAFAETEIVSYTITKICEQYTALRSAILAQELQPREAA